MRALFLGDIVIMKTFSLKLRLHIRNEYAIIILNKAMNVSSKYLMTYRELLVGEKQSLRILNVYRSLIVEVR